MFADVDTHDNPKNPKKESKQKPTQSVVSQKSTTSPISTQGGSTASSPFDLETNQSRKPVKEDHFNKLLRRGSSKLLSPPGDHMSDPFSSPVPVSGYGHGYATPSSSHVTRASSNPWETDPFAGPDPFTSQPTRFYGGGVTFPQNSPTQSSSPGGTKGTPFDAFE